MDKKKALVVGSCFLVLVLLAGCTTTSGSRSYGSKAYPDESLEVSSVLRFDDVPIPTGFTTLDKESFAFQNDVTRVALLKYIGGKGIDEVVAFYKAQMPMYNWNPINIIEYERRIMNYEKEGESCIVTIEGKGRKSIVTIGVSPKSRPMKVRSEK